MSTQALPPARTPRGWPKIGLSLALGLALGVVALLALARAWLLRDPEPYFRARHARIAAVQEGPVTRSGIATEQDVELGGHIAGKESASLIADTRHLLVASIAYPANGNERATGLAVIPEVSAFRRAIRDTPPAVMLALDYLRSRPYVDTARVELCGASFGVPFAAVVGALDPRVTRVWLVQGGANPRAMIEAGVREEIPFAPARGLVASVADVLASGPRLDPARWVGRIALRPVVMINTEEDERIPRASAEALHAAARAPKQVVWLPGLHVQPNRPDVLAALVGAVFDRLTADADKCRWPATATNRYALRRIDGAIRRA